MKVKHILLGLFLAGSIAAGIVGCSKEAVEPTTDNSADNSALIGQVTDMTADYLAVAGASTSANKDGRWKQIIGADLFGALSSFWITLVINHGDSDNDNSWAGGAGVVGGAAASVLASIRNGGSPGEITAVENASNPLDALGRLHYEIIDEVNSNPSDYILNGNVRFPEYYELAFGRLVAAGILTPSDRAHVPMSELEANHGTVNTNASLVASHNNSTHPEYLPSERAILGQYFGALMGSNDYNAFATYSIGVENAVVASSMSNKSKAMLLMEMATARHGMAYWQ